MMEVVGQAADRYDAEVFAYCQMGNHYHLVLRTRRANLSRVMRHLNGEYARKFNLRHELEGHLFQRRFHSVLVDSDAYLMEVCRYVELNPVRAGLVARADDWAWSSFRANIGMEVAPAWLACARLHEHVLRRHITTAIDRRRAALAYAQFVGEGLDANPWADKLNHEVFLGDDAFVARMQALGAAVPAACPEIPASQRGPQTNSPDRAAASAKRADEFRVAYRNQGMTMAQIARHANLSISRISRLIARAERDSSDRA